MERINVRLEAKLKHELEAEARQRGVTPSRIVRDALKEHMQRQAPRQSCYDVAERLGLIGIYKDTPTDLSSNPKHMEGFGGG
jgi:hypothetical protein